MFVQKKAKTNKQKKKPLCEPTIKASVSIRKIVINDMWL